MKQDGRVLEYASAELKGDREVVMAAVKKNWVGVSKRRKIGKN